MAESLKVIVIFAHPDEGEKYAGGTSALLARRGHAVKFLSLTNGDGGHFEMSGGELVQRRAEEAKRAQAALGIAEYEILDNHDGSLLPTLELRNAIIKQIREWEADVVITFHPEGGAHADNRYAGKAVSDASAFVALVQNVVPDTRTLDKPPLYLLMPDYSMKKRYRADVVVGIDGVLESKLLGCGAHESQFFEYQPWTKGRLDEVPEAWESRRQWLLRDIADFLHVSEEMASSLVEMYGEQRASRIRYAEPFEIASYNSGGTEERVRLFIEKLAEEAGA
ncbi:PIG-L deacetylase family protein [Paenibacillus sp. YIM B09110]|uniref:PIG-L deacetylase family protein n=1 Tax=Paenibacillus sp. YIM B09110 TaxID=3126102 RepID=UPI00301E04CC